MFLSFIDMDVPWGDMTGHFATSHFQIQALPDDWIMVNDLGKNGDKKNIEIIL